MKSPSERINFACNFADGEITRLEKACETQGITMPDFVRRAILVAIVAAENAKVRVKPFGANRDDIDERPFDDQEQADGWWV